MNYCAVKTAGDRLSKWDVYGIRTLFGVKPPQALTTPGGLCLDDPSGNNTNGVALQSFACHDPSVLGNQQWTYDVATRTIRQGGKCLDSYDSTHFYIDACYNDAPQQVIFDAAELRGFGDQCLVPSGNLAGTAGTQLTLNPCVSSLYDNPVAPFQAWTYDPATRELRDGSALCLQASGSNVVIEPCNGSLAGQRWTLTNGLIQSDLGTCAEEDLASQLLYMDSCSTVPAVQRFHFAGPIKMQDQCFQLLGPSANGTQIGLGACDSTRNDQTFDWYF
jgi:hypothetical protein